LTNKKEVEINNFLKQFNKGTKMNIYLKLKYPVTNEEYNVRFWEQVSELNKVDFDKLGINITFMDSYETPKKWIYFATNSGTYESRASGHKHLNRMRVFYQNIQRFLQTGQKD